MGVTEDQKADEPTVTGAIAGARAYVTSRFFPPLPAAYGDLLIAALNDVEGEIELPEDLPVLPREAYSRDGKVWVRSRALIESLRCSHLLEEDE